MRNKKILKENKNYPKILKEISDAPSELFWKGDWNDEIFENTLAVVGSRKMTSYGKRVTEEIIGNLAFYGITIVSGFMYGIDAVSHKSALNAKGKTIAVMPCGVDVVHPSYQKSLYKEIEENGLIVSEYEKEKPSEKWIYPRRNRIVAGLSKAVLVVEAGEKSGSLITANLALKYKRKLFAVPGSIFSPTSKGTNNLIKKNLAEPVLCAEDVLKFFKKNKTENKKTNNSNFNDKENEIINILKEESADLNEIFNKSKMTISEINTTLLMLEMKGIIEKEGLKYKLKN